MRFGAGWVAVLAVLASACGPRRPTSAELDPALAALVTADTVALAAMDVDRLRSSPYYSRWIGPRIQALEKENGVSLAGQDVQIAVMTNGKSASTFAKITRGVVRLGSKDPLPAANGGIPSALLARIRSIPPRNQVWAAGIGSAGLLDQILPQTGMLAGLRPIGEGLEGWTFGLAVENGLWLEAKATYVSEQEAQRVHDGLRGLISLVRVGVPKASPQLTRAFDALRIEREKTTVHISAELSPEEVDALQARTTPRGR